MPDNRQDHDRALALNHFWNELVRPTGDLDTVVANLDPDLAKTVRRLRVLAQTPPPASARMRVRLPQFAAPSSQVTLPTSNGRVPSGPPLTGSTLVPRARQPHWLRLGFLAAMVLLLGGIGSYVADAPPGNRVFQEITPDRRHIVAPVEESSSDVPMFGGNAARTGVMPGPAPSSTPAIAWRYDAASGVTAPAIVDGVAYVGVGQLVGGSASSDGVGVVALDRATGNERWTFTTTRAVLATPGVVDGVVYATDQTGSLYAIDAASGMERWTYAPGGGRAGAPVIVDGVVFYVTNMDGFSNPAVADGRVYVAGGLWFGGNPGRTDVHAVDAQTGAVRWTFDDFPFPPDQGVIVALDADDGAVVWQYDGAPLALEPTVADGQVIFSDRTTLHALDAATGEQRWSVSPEGGAFWEASSLVVAAGQIVVIGDMGLVLSLDAVTGETRWQTQPQATWMASGPVIAGDTIFVVTTSGVVIALDAIDGQEQWRLTIPEMNAVVRPLVVTDGTIYVATLPEESTAGGGGLAALAEVVTP